ncbi:hypothetical protein B0H19DRAFT_654259 [Mycena capillaripes]|nr:hypothetical protein B0H19DRAFT_654259 [Mycena capillaripes]
MNVRGTYACGRTVEVPFLSSLKLRKVTGFLQTDLSQSDGFLAAPQLEKAQFTILVIDYIHLERCDVLNRLDNLISCGRQSYPTRVETFILWANPVEISDALNALTIPVLRKLQHNNFLTRSSDPVETVARLTSRFGSNLEELCVPGASETEDNYRCCDGFASVSRSFLNRTANGMSRSPFWRNGTYGTTEKTLSRRMMNRVRYGLKRTTGSVAKGPKPIKLLTASYTVSFVDRTISNLNSEVELKSLRRLGP